MLKRRLLVVLLSVAMVSASAGKFKPSPIFLKGEKQINVVFDYSQVKYDGDSQQKQYKDKGKKWVEEWEGKRRDNNAEIFTSKMNGELKNVSVGEYPNAKYTMIVVVVDCDFGAYAGPMSVPAKLKGTIKIVKTGTKEVLASIDMKVKQNSFTVIGTPVDFDRMYLAFDQLGQETGKKLAKVLK